MSPSRSRSPPDIKYRYNGLINQGSTCYLNSVLQVLFMTKDFRKAVMSSERHPDENPYIDLQLRTLFTALKSRTARTNDVTQKLGIERVYEQSDAAEYFEKILRLASADASQIFQGSLVHATECSECRTTSEEPAAFWNLPLALMNSRGQDYSVVRGVQDFFKVSEFIGDNQLYCDECCAKHDATAKYEIKQHPEVLMLLLKRFEFSYSQMSFVKNSCVVGVPRELTIPENQNYEIYAFVEHFGGLRGGHYTATIKSQDEDRWYEFNDSTVSPLHNQPFQNHNTDKSNTAYLLFYRKKNLGSVDNREVSDDEVLPPDTNKNYHQPQHAKKMKKRDENTEIKSSSNARGEGSSDEETQNKGAQSKQTGPYSDSRDAEARQKQKYEEGVGGEAEYEHAGKKEDELRANKRRKIAEETDKEGKNGHKEQGHAGRIEGKKENTEAEGLASTNVKELERYDSLKDSDGKRSVSSGQQDMQKNHRACKEETGSSKQTKHPQGGKNADAMEGNKPKARVTNQSQRPATSVMKAHVPHRAEDQDRRRRGDDALITGGNRGKSQVIKNNDEQNQITSSPLPSQEGPGVKRKEEKEATGYLRAMFKRFPFSSKKDKKSKNRGNDDGEDGDEANFELNAKKKSDKRERADEKKRSKGSQKKQSRKPGNNKPEDGKEEKSVGCSPWRRKTRNKTDDSQDYYV